MNYLGAYKRVVKRSKTPPWERGGGSRVTKAIGNWIWFFRILKIKFITISASEHQNDNRGVKFCDIFLKIYKSKIGNFLKFLLAYFKRKMLRKISNSSLKRVVMIKTNIWVVMIKTNMIQMKIEILNRYITHSIFLKLGCFPEFKNKITKLTDSKLKNTLNYHQN